MNLGGDEIDDDPGAFNIADARTIVAICDAA